MIRLIILGTLVAVLALFFSATALNVERDSSDDAIWMSDESDAGTVSPLSLISTSSRGSETGTATLFLAGLVMLSSAIVLRKLTR